MGLIFDTHSARLYQSWHHSPQGREMDRLVERSVRSLLNPQPGEKLLDVGCGEGDHMILFNKMGFDISGVDASPYMISRARDRLGRYCDLRSAMAEDLPFEDNEFDLVAFINTLEFLDDPYGALREAGRVARRGIFIGVMNSLSWNCLVNKLQSLFHDSLFNHIRFYSLWELKSYLQMALGPVPISWSCSHLWPSFVGRISGFMADQWNLKYCPFGSFLGLAARVVYQVKTDNLPLKIKLKKTEEPIPGRLAMGKHPCEKGSAYGQRGLSV